MQDQDRIRERAYAIWEREGRPHGRDADHWDRARQEIEGGAEPGPAPVAAPAAEAKPAKPRRKAAIRVEAPVAESLAAEAAPRRRVSRKKET
ncbi:DUF2934 domain-containing protein [Roseomonas sp. OT10]|uniref:DUF2934 domain-containing protein n=1 Tax=Roseomonas cutis TaxID=2897332 RepID=UPI001E342BD0|nr:DUF2934 domain-containing protein [Roseomonas sp. OT10]UFN47299.1 DUF2934 domain-containing protein [Roseomonas sp. OT10]